MTAVTIVVLLVALQRLAELVYARRNTTRLLAAGGIEHGARHYRLFVVLHGGWLIAVFAFADPAATLSAPLLVLFVALQVARLWVIASLGRYWTTRVITFPGAPLIRHGPYRFMRHPNYAIVVAEIAVLPLVFGEWALALVFSALNLALLRYRIRVENVALAERVATGPG